VERLSDRFLVDACASIAFHGAARLELSPTGLAALRSGDVAVSSITVWEITRKVAIGKLAPLNGQDQRGCVAFLRERGYRLLPLSAEAAERANALQPHHADPMDRLLIAQALLDGLTILTSDRAFTPYGVQTLW